jgi:alcohol dehydrogenase class IV
MNTSIYRPSAAEVVGGSSKTLVVGSIRAIESLDAWLASKALAWSAEARDTYVEVLSHPDVSTLSSLFMASRRLAGVRLLAVGGGSAIDTAKLLLALSALDQEPKNIEDLVANTAFNVDGSAAEFDAIPTTAGSGSESTSFATVWDTANKKKHSVIGSWLIPKRALLIPELLEELPLPQFAISALDAYAHAFDSVWNSGATERSRKLAKAAIRNMNASVSSIRANGRPSEWAGRALVASNLAGHAINLTRTSLSHALSYSLTLEYKVPHGYSCGVFVSAIAGYAAKNSPDTDLRDFLDSAVVKNALSHIDYLLSVSGEHLPQEVEASNVDAAALDYSRAGNFALKISQEQLLGLVSDATSGEAGSD